MLFPSLTFLLIFFPLFLASYFFVSKKYQNFVLFLFSLIFYAWGEPVYIVILLFSTSLDFWISKQLGKKVKKSQRVILLMTSITMNLGLLFYFKYSAFLKPWGILSPKHFPIGISFYTFQTMSYTIDVYLGKQQPTDSFIDFATYVTMFFQLIAGPIVRFKDVQQALICRFYSRDQFLDGLRVFILGLGKKVLLADTIGLLWETLAVFEGWTCLEAWLALIAFGLQIYFDFSGYSDMAVGLAKICGFTFPENFNHPYFATSIQDFWRRWHISLGTWFRDYVYIPLGGSRVNFGRWIFNMLCVWGLTGLWHGASFNFLLWGLYYGVLLIFEKTFVKKANLPIWAQHFYTLVAVLIGWAFFAFEDSQELILFLKGLFSIHPLITAQGLYALKNYGLLLTLGILLCYPKIMNRWMSLNGIWVILILILCIVYLIDGSYHPFLYFRF